MRISNYIFQQHLKWPISYGKKILLPSTMIIKWAIIRTKKLFFVRSCTPKRSYPLWRYLLSYTQILINKINVNQNGTNITLIWNQKLTVRYPFHDENKNYSDFRNFVGQMVILMVRGIQNRSNFLAISLFVQKKCEIFAFRFFNSAYRYLKPIYKKYTVKT